ncbi:DUF3068 domain-containing protein [Nocardiopsis alba]|uniref:DUF3068 domain-containing protein n=1 Tax=Nocardiopsis alba TaxID=53437 RepID=A0A7K2IPQ2_9ACTN|nr:DUF3068 domain-containing protein [Nocardiopsis alba]
MSTFSQMGRAPGGLSASPPKGTLLVAAGAFLMTLALLLPLYVHDRVALIPGEFSQTLRMTASDAAYLDTATWQNHENVEVERATRVDASLHGTDWSAWEMTVDTSVSDRIIDHWSRRVIVDRETGRAVNCCGEHVDGDRAVRQAGLVLNWPAGAPEDGHSFYDAEMRSAPSVGFDEEDEVGGLAVRRYTQTVPPTQVPESAREVPAFLFDGGARGTVEATRWLELERTFWVEPTTGAVVNMTEERSETLRPLNGSGKVSLLEAELSLAEGQVASLVEGARVRSLLLRAVDLWVPWAAGPLGALTILLGLVQAWRARGEDDPGTGRDEEEAAVPTPVEAG